MRKFVRDHAGEFLAAELLHQARTHRDRRVLRIAAGGERIGLRLVDDEHARHRQAGAAGQLGHEMDEVGRAVAVDLMGAVHRQHHAVRIPVGKQVHRGRDHERDHRTAGAADQIADAHEEAGETGQKNGSLQIAHCRLLARPRRIAEAGIPKVGIAPASASRCRWCVEAPRLARKRRPAGPDYRNVIWRLRIPPPPPVAPRLLVQRQGRRLHCPATGSARGCSLRKRSGKCGCSS